MTAQWFSEMINVFCCAAARETSPALANAAAAGRRATGTVPSLELPPKKAWLLRGKE